MTGRLQTLAGLFFDAEDAGRITRLGQISLLLAGLLLFAVAFTVPGGSGITGTNLDDSYPLVIEDGARRGEVSGTDIIYTHGPLGYLFQPQGLGGFRVQRLLYAVLKAGLSVYVSFVILAATPLALRIVLFVFLLNAPAPTVVCAWIAVRLVQPPAQSQWRRAELWGLPAVLGLCAMVKFTELVAGVVAIGGAATVLAWRRQWRDAAQAAGVFVVTMVGAWLIAGQPLGGFWSYLRNSWEMAQGFATMAIVPARPILLWGLAGVALLGCAAGVALQSSRRRVECAILLLTILAAAFLDWKHGFVRADNHVINFFSPLPLYVAAILAAGRLRPWWHAGFVALALAIWVGGVRTAKFGWLVIVPGYAKLSDAPREFFGIGAAESRAATAKRERITREHADLPKIRDAVGRAPVDVFNYRQAYAYINGLHLAHRPVFQSFAAYTPRLQRINYDFYQTQRRPNLALLRVESADSRWPWLDDAPLMLQMLTDWQPLERERGCLLLQHSGDAARGEWRAFSAGSARWGESVPVPPHPPESLVAITLDGSRRGTWGRLKRFLYHGANLRLSIDLPGETKQGYNFVPEMAAERVLLSPCLESVDEIIGWQTGVLPMRRATSFRLTPWVGHEGEFEPDFRYRLWIWTPRVPGRDPRLQAHARSLLYPYLPAVPIELTPVLETMYIDGDEFGGSRPPCRVSMPVPPDAPGIEGRAIVTREHPGTGEVTVRARLLRSDGKVVNQGTVTPGLGAAEIVKIGFEFDAESIADGKARIVLDVSAPGGDPDLRRPMVVWGPFKWQGRK